MEGELVDVAAVPFCRVCRRSSELKWRKHAFSKAHQRAAGDFLSSRVARLREVATFIHDKQQDESTLKKLFCVFCDVTISTLELWIEHYASAIHRQKVDTFCKENRCDPSQQVRAQLCIQQQDIHKLQEQLKENREAATVIQEHARRADNIVASVIARLKETTGAAQPTGHQGSGSLRTRFDQAISTRPRPIATDVGYGAGLCVIKKQRWGKGIANIHSSAVPPWMVETEEEYKQRNRLPSRPVSGSKRHRPGQTDRATAFVDSTYDAETWLPNFGSVWQEGPRSKTKNDFTKLRKHNRTVGTRETKAILAPSLHREPDLQNNGTAAQTPAAKSNQLAECQIPQASGKHETTHDESRSDTTAADIAVVSSTHAANAELVQKMQLLLAQKERLRAKMAARRQASS